MPTATITLPAGIYDYTIDGVPGQATVFGAPDFYVDSINGSDSNDGLTSGTAFQTLSKAVTEIDAMGDGTVVSLAGNSVWREAFTPAPNGLRIAWDGNGTPPVITGFDVQTGWVDDTATVAGRWYKDVAHDSNSTNRQVVIEDNAMMDRVDTAAEVTTAGTYYSANCGTANPIRVYINTGAENPNTNGKTYEVTTRLRAVYLQDNCSISGVVARGAITNNGPLEVGTGSNVTNCVAAFGTKHNFLIEDGVMTDVVAIDNDNSTPSEPTNTVGVAYAVDASSMNVTMRRVLVKSTREATGMFSHSTASPGNDHASITLDQCVFDMASGAAMTGGAQSITVSNCAAFGASLNGAMNVFAHSAFSVERTTAVINVDAVAIANSSATGDVTLSQSAITKTVTSARSDLSRPHPGGKSPRAMSRLTCHQAILALHMVGCREQPAL